MLRFGAILAVLCVLVFACAAQDQLKVGRVSVVGSGSVVDVEIQTEGTITPQSQMLTGPDRVAVDFPGAIPSADLRAMTINHGSVRAVRASLYAKNPPVTRVVLDLSGPQTYQIFPTRNSVRLKLTPIAGIPALASVGSPAAGETQAPTPPEPSMSVSFHNGMLTIHADRVTLAKVLFEVQKQTGAEIAIPSGAEAEEMSAEIGPAPAREVLASLLNGSRYNFIFVGNDRGHTLKKAILSVR
jgi:AMIN domain-containing protein